MKKKKKTLYIRKVRKTSQTKYIKYFAKKFPKLYDKCYYGKYKAKNKMLYSLFLFFHCMSMRKILNFFKQFGIIKNYKNFIHRKKSIKSIRLLKKYKKINKFYKIKRRAARLIKILFVKKYALFSKIHKKRYKNVKNKKEMCLYFSYRHILFLPVRGQRTKTNAKTRKDFNII